MPHADCVGLRVRASCLPAKDDIDILWNAAVAEVEKHITAAIVACMNKRSILFIFD